MNRRSLLLLGTAALSGLGGAYLAQARSPRSGNRPTASPNLADRNTADRNAADRNSAAPARPFRIGILSDLNSAYGSTTYDPEVTQAVTLIRQWKPDLVLCSGDMVAGQSTRLSEAEIQAMWAGFDRTIRTPLRQANLPFGFTVGNHDASGALNSRGQFSFERDRNLAKAYWNSHDTGLTFIDRAQFPFYYSFQIGSIYCLVWDASTASIPPAQLAWVERSLKSPAAQQAKLRLAIGHLPLYPIAVGRDRPGEFLDNNNALRDLLIRHNVHTYISGHQHVYYPGQSSSQQGQLNLLYAGAAGSGPRRMIIGDAPPQKTVTLVEVDFQSKTPTTRYSTYRLPQGTLLTNRELPPFIESPYGRITRQP